MTAETRPGTETEAQTRPVPRAVGEPRLEAFGLREALRLGQTAGAFARGGVHELTRRAPALLTAPRTQSGRGLASALRLGAEELGPAYIKFGQIIASSPGLFPQTLSWEFRKCLDAVPPIPPFEVLERVREEFGAPVTSLFESFDPEPLASASIAQVHAATFEGRDVVVKVRRPGLIQRFRRDLRIIFRIAQALEGAHEFFHAFEPTAIVRDFAYTLHEEIDFVREAESMERFETGLRSYGTNELSVVPGVIWERTSERVLTMERAHGVAPDDRETIQDEWGLDMVPLFQHAVRGWVEAALVHGFFHGDLHAGNLLVTERGELVYLDFGIMGRLADEHRDILRALIPTMVIDEDWGRAARLLGAFAPGAERDEAEVDAIAVELEAQVGGFIRTRMADISYGSLMSESLRIAREHGRLLPNEIMLIAKQFLYFERYARILAPDYAVFGDERIFETLLGYDTQPGTTEPDIRFRSAEVAADVSVYDGGRSVHRESDVHFTWCYEPERQGLVTLYEKAKTKQWNAASDIDWSIEIDPEEAGAGFGAYLNMIPSESLKKMNDSERAAVGLSLSAWMNSQFMHGEQGALMATAKIVEQVPNYEAKLYGSTQVMDEARHVEVYSKYLHEKLGESWPINENLATLLDMVMADSRWDVTYLGMQVIVEGVALAAFGLMNRFSTEPLIKQITKMIMADEARHVAFGTLSLDGIYADMTDAELREREEFVLEAAHLMRDRFLADEVWEALGVAADDPLRDMQNSPMAQVFRRLIFSKITPNLRKLGLLSERLSDGLVEIGAVDDTLERVAG